MEHLTERRPAVFLFNVRSSVDVFLVAALVRDNWTGEATKELMSSHVCGQLGKMLDVAVLAPVSVEGWKLRNLRARIEQVRAAYQATLTEWPAGTPDAPIAR